MRSLVKGSVIKDYSSGKNKTKTLTPLTPRTTFLHISPLVSLTTHSLVHQHP